MTTIAIINKNILLAEDDADDRLLFEDALNDIDRDTELTTVKDGVELLTALHSNASPSPSVIFLDLNMPRMDGFECLTEIKADNNLNSIPIVVFSTSDSITAIDTTYSLGANFFIRKPSSFQLLKKSIKTILTTDLSKRPSRAEYFLNVD